MVSKRALMLLKKQNEAITSSKRGRDDGGSTSHAKEVELVDVEKEGIVGDDGSVGEAAAREKKRHRGDGPHKKHHSSKNAGKDNVLGDPSMRVSPNMAPCLQVGERAGPILIEIGPEERWNLGDRKPLQAFGAFKLSADAGSYASFTRDEIARRSRHRLGMFISDYERMLDDEEYGREFNEEAERCKRELVEANRAIGDIEARERSLLERIGVAERAHQTAKEVLEVKVRELEAEVVRLGTEKDSLMESRSAIDQINQKLNDELETVKNDLEQADLELVKSLEEGYNGCLERWAATGADLKDHTFAKYSSELTQKSQNEEENS